MRLNPAAGNPVTERFQQFSTSFGVVSNGVLWHGLGMETEEEFEAFMAAHEAALIEEFGPDHQAILASGGRLIAEFEGWHD